MNSPNNDIPEMSNSKNKYSDAKSVQGASQIPSEISEKAKQEMEEQKKKLEKLQKFIVKKYPYTEAIGILPPQAMSIFIEEENLDLQFPKMLDEIKKSVHLYMIIPEE